VGSGGTDLTDLTALVAWALIGLATLALSLEPRNHHTFLVVPPLALWVAPLLALRPWAWAGARRAPRPPVWARARRSPAREGLLGLGRGLGLPWAAPRAGRWAGWGRRQ
jgi:hypothetical protein